MKEKVLHIWDRFWDEYYGVCKLSLFFVAGSVAWMETVTLIGKIGQLLIS